MQWWRILFWLTCIGILVSLGCLAYVYIPHHEHVQEDSLHARILFAGDMMFDRSVRTTAQARGDDFLLSCMDPVLASADLVVANLEGPITPAPSQSVGSSVGTPDNYVFTFPLSTADLLYRHNIRIVNLGNNHIENFGTEGVRSTIESLQKSGVGYFGDPLASRVASATIRGVHVAFINYNEFARQNTALTASTTIAQIKEARARGELPIVYTHWGIEYEPVAPARMRALAHAFVDAGAVAVVGSHPHVVEDHETYRDAPVYYSLGNFIFDQYWNDAVTHGLVLEFDLSSRGIENVREIPVLLEHSRQTCPQNPVSSA